MTLLQSPARSRTRLPYFSIPIRISETLLYFALPKTSLWRPMQAAWQKWTYLAMLGFPSFQSRARVRSLYLFSQDQPSKSTSIGLFACKTPPEARLSPTFPQTRLHVLLPSRPILLLQPTSRRISLAAFTHQSVTVTLVASHIWSCPCASLPPHDALYGPLYSSYEPFQCFFCLNISFSKSLCAGIAISTVPLISPSFRTCIRRNDLQTRLYAMKNGSNAVSQVSLP